jgi:hypothetical protein
MYHSLRFQYKARPIAFTVTCQQGTPKTIPSILEALGATQKAGITLSNASRQVTSFS